MSCVVFCCITLHSVMCAGMNKVDEKLKVGRTKRPEGALFNEESQKKQLTPVPAKRESTCHRQGKHISPSVFLSLILLQYVLDSVLRHVFSSLAPLIDSEAQVSILEHSKISCSTCSAVTYKTCPGFKKHLKICQKVRGPAK